MRKGGMVKRGAVAAVLTAAASLALAAPAPATFHEILIQEVFPGSTSDPGEDYVTLQMYSAGQGQVGGHTLTIYASNGTVAGTAQFPAAPGGNVANDANQSTILIGAVSSVLGVTPDLVDPDVAAMDPDGGAACWESSDCVAWGNFTPPIGGLPSPAGTPAFSPSSFPDGFVMVRKANTADCGSLLEQSDDTNVSNDDFSGGGGVPRNNATTPTEVPCFDTQITKGPDGKTTDRTPTFKFKSVPGGGTLFTCAIDHPEDANGCSSPFTTSKLKLGKHKLFVIAKNSVAADDPTPATRMFKVVKKH